MNEASIVIRDCVDDMCPHSMFGMPLNMINRHLRQVNDKWYLAWYCQKTGKIIGWRPMGEDAPPMSTPVPDNCPFLIMQRHVGFVDGLIESDGSPHVALWDGGKSWEDSNNLVWSDKDLAEIKCKKAELIIREVSDG